ncbi:hypothetical protein ACNKHU_19665 [Shigella flexneri]
MLRLCCKKSDNMIADTVFRNAGGHALQCAWNMVAGSTPCVRSCASKPVSIWKTIIADGSRAFCIT